MENHRHHPVQYWLPALLLLTTQGDSASAAKLTLQETVEQIESKLIGCVMADADGPDWKFGFTELFMYYSHDLYKTYGTDTDKNQQKVKDSVYNINKCAKTAATEVLKKSDETATVKDFSDWNVHSESLAKDLITIARDNDFFKNVKTVADADKALKSFSFKDTLKILDKDKSHQCHFFDVEITQTGDYFKINLISSNDPKGFFSIMLAEMMGNVCVKNYLRQAFFDEMICDPLFALASKGALMSGFPMLAFAMDILPGHGGRIAHVVRLVVCLGDAAVAKIKKYNFLDGIKANLASFAEKMTAAMAKVQAKNPVIGAVFDRISELKIDNWDPLRAKLDEMMDAKNFNFWKSVGETVDVIRLISKLAGPEFAGNTELQEMLSIGTGASDAKKTAEASKAVVEESGKIKTILADAKTETFLAGAKTETILADAKMETILAGAKTVLLKISLLKDKTCGLFWKSLVKLKNGFWKKTTTEILKEDPGLQKELAELKDLKE